MLNFIRFIAFAAFGFLQSARNKVSDICSAGSMVSFLGVFPYQRTRHSIDVPALWSHYSINCVLVSVPVWISEPNTSVGLRIWSI